MSAMAHKVRRTSGEEDDLGLGAFLTNPIPNEGLGICGAICDVGLGVFPEREEDPCKRRVTRTRRLRRPRLASSRPKAFARTRPLSRRFFHLPRDYCLRVRTVHRRLPLAGRFGAWLCSQIRRLPRKRDRPDSPGLGLQYVATKIDGGKTSRRVALTMVESCCSVPLH